MLDKSTNQKNEVGYFHKKRPEMLKYIPESALKILEVGCAEGTFCSTLRRIDREIWGLEMNPDAAREARAVCQFVLVGDFDTVFEQLPKDYFDCVIFNDVLEHMYSPWDTIKLVKSLLSPTGVLVTSIPNFRFISNIIEIISQGEFKYKPGGGILDDTHIRFFTQKSMQRMFEEQGYEVLQKEGINERNDWKMKLVNLISLGSLNDARYNQFAIVAKPKN